MKLLDVLASGVRGAENGSVDILVRGTSTRAQVFTDYDGSGAQTPAQALTLDANGGAIWYVNQAVTCRAYSSTGAVVRQFTAFEAATDVEVRSQSFTGQDYTTGASAAGNPTLLSTVLDLWKTSAGAIDWKVLLAGASVNIQNAFGPIAGPLFFNVKDPAYGAKGDGVTDDRAAVQAACTAAAAVGGWVAFPASTSSYLIGAPGITCAGVAGFIGPKGAVIACTTASVQVITISAVSNGKFQVFGLTWSFSDTTIKWIAQSAGDLSLYDTTVTYPQPAAQPANGYVITMSGGADAVTIVNSTLTMGVMSTPVSQSAPVVAKTVAFLYAEFNLAANGATGNWWAVQATDGIIAGCDFTATNGVAGYINEATSTQALTVVGCDFATPSAGTLAAAIFVGSATPVVFEFGNTVAVGTPMFRFASTPTSDVSRQWPRAMTTESTEFFVQSDAASIDLSTAFLEQVYGIYRLRRTTATNQTITLPTPRWGGQELVLEIVNDSAGTPTETLTTVKGLASIAPTPGQRELIWVKAMLVSGAFVWAMPGVAWT